MTQPQLQALVLGLPWQRQEDDGAIFASDFLLSAPRPSRLTRTEDGDPLLCLHVVVPPDAINGTNGPQHFALLCSGVYAGLPEKLMRKPEDLNYSRLRLAIQACVQPFVQRETLC